MMIGVGIAELVILVIFVPIVVYFYGSIINFLLWYFNFVNRNIGRLFCRLFRRS